MCLDPGFEANALRLLACRVVASLFAFARNEPRTRKKDHPKIILCLDKLFFETVFEI